MNDPAPPTTRNRRAHGRSSRRSLALLTAGMLAAALAVAGCGESGADSTSAAREPQQATQAPENGKAADGAADRAGAPEADGRQGEQGGAAEQKPPKIAAEHIVRKARLTVRVKDVASALDDTRTTVESAGGYVGDETTDRDGRSHERSRLVLRVPQEKYADVLKELSGSGKLIERKVSADDVTDKVVDVESRIASQKSSVKRVRELMDKATELSDIVSLEGQLSTRQAALEALQAQQASLKDRTTLATITLVLSETEVEKEKDDGPGFADALDGGWTAFVTTMRWIAVAIGAALPFLAALALLTVAWRLIRGHLPQRLRRSARSAALPTGTPGGGRPWAPAKAPAEPPAPSPSEPPAKGPKSD
ncbi:DUF4349 domain-containing protein [Streptomyces winkii]|uniref:DUF4349 domain-containing protein n=1 Tax=Streptomyces winkii TaxID=3051178 RepID=UPI0028D55B20|nr:DUF4349 domain-containing protein [Streptomyces sp. DSM 40971]